MDLNKKLNVDDESEEEEEAEEESKSSGRDESMPTTSNGCGGGDMIKIENNDEDEIVHKKKRRFVLFNESDDDIEEVNSSQNHVDSDADSKRIKSSSDQEVVAVVEPTSSSSKSLDKEESTKRISKSKAALLQAAQKKKEAENELLKMFDTSDASYWPRVYSSRRENSLNFKDLLKRECGQIRPKVFQDKAINNIDYVRRMKLSKTLKFHEGCVNSLNFNRIGTLLCSGADDHQICIYDWARSRPILNFDSGHKSNVFQSKFIPFCGDTQIATSARDGQVRLALISSSGSHIGSKRIAKHADSCHKLAMEYDSSNIFLSCGEDSVVYEIDLRQETPAKILNVKCARDFKVPLYSIASNPMDSNQFVVSGRDQYIRIYDKRMLVKEKSKILKKFTSKSLAKPERVSVTSAVFNNNGTEIVASYSDEDIYLFDVSKEDDSDAIQRYKGHRNSDTIKSVNFYGADSSYVISGSDCGRIFFWDKKTEQIVQTLVGDASGVVNVLEPHPSFPILATSGLDYDVKVWSPIGEELNDLKNLPEIVKDNQKNRDSERHFSLSTFEFELLLLLMHRPNNPSSLYARLGRLRRSNRDNNEDNSSSSSSSDDDEIDIDDIYDEDEEDIDEYDEEDAIEDEFDDFRDFGDEVDDEDEIDEDVANYNEDNTRDEILINSNQANDGNMNSFFNVLRDESNRETITNEEEEEGGSNNLNQIKQEEIVNQNLDDLD